MRGHGGIAGIQAIAAMARIPENSSIARSPGLNPTWISTWIPTWIPTSIRTRSRAAARSAWRGIASRVAFAFAGVAAAGCGPVAVRIDRTEGRSLEYLWSVPSESRTAYYVVGTDGSFASSGGALARDRATTDRTTLDDEDVGTFLRLLDATDFARRPDAAGQGEPLHELRVRVDRSTHAFVVRGANPSIDALREWCASIALRKYRDVIDAQPEAGVRRR